jgi:protein SCO1/2
VPIILTLNYSDCPMLCSMQLNGVVQAMKQVDWTAGKEFRVVTVSLDPTETPDRARKTKARYLTQYGRPEATGGWHFLTGSEANIRAVADAIGFRYGYNEKREEWVHPAAISIMTPDAVIARYLYGIEYHPKTLRLSLVEASEGKIGTTVDRLILYCFHYDETEGRYAPVAFNIMRVGGALAVVLLGGFLGALWLNERRRKKQDKGDPRVARTTLDPTSVQS